MIDLLIFLLNLYLFGRPTPRFTRAGQVWVWSRGAVIYGTDVVDGCKELSAGEDSCLCLTDCRREFFIAADAWKNTRHGVGCNSLLGRKSENELMQRSLILFSSETQFVLMYSVIFFDLSLWVSGHNDQFKKMLESELL
jgi:hypothetical protein